MSDEENLENENAAAAAADGVGPQLRAAREAKGLSIEQVAAETRISSRHIENIEAGDFSELPGRTYAIGFAKTIAKTVGLDQGDVAAMVGAEMQDDAPRERNGSGNTFEPGDPSRAPGGKLVWFSLFAVVLLLVGIFFASRALFAPAAELPALTEEEEVEPEGANTTADAAPGAADADAPSAGDPVVFTAEGEVWVRFYDAQSRVLSEQTLSEGDSYTIPADADGPRIITGRPDLLAITIGGRSVPKLSTEIETLEDVEVSAGALLSRQATAPSDSETGSVN
ncbi:helix-turn-helix domain-containing protein [Aurantiacibacter sp. MUD61]|uniref:helix-turn-helix domain-containing protein n=1 Tax=Aurantiacibacter sp. MUD61 TaxID=3009083 RepID=UPI0022F0A569|nr:helix-turn-helix domain-containing protein [Aurantiacibacter sp. MUD61]